MTRLRPFVSSYVLVALARAGTIAIAAAIVAYLAGLVLPPLRTEMALLGLAWAVMAMGQTLPLGIAGVTTFGQAAFALLGAFAYAYLVTEKGLSAGIALVGSGLIAIALSALFAPALLRLRGYVLAMGTLAMWAAIASVLPSMDWLSGGFAGKLVPPIIADAQTRLIIYLAAIVAVISLIQAYLRTPNGRRLVAIRDDEAAARSVGIPVQRVRGVVFALSGGLAAIGGAMYGAELNFVSAEGTSLGLLVGILLVAILGGIRSMWGPLAGGLAYMVLIDLSSHAGKRASLVQGLIFLAIVMVVPGGIVDPDRLSESHRERLRSVQRKLRLGSGGLRASG